MHSCREVAERAPALFEKHLGLRERFWLRLHLFLCDDCRRYVDQLARVVSTLPEIERDPPDAGVERQLLAEFRKFKGSGPR